MVEKELVDVSKVDVNKVDVNKVDVNKAVEEELTTIPGVGPALAQRIVHSRPYTSQQDISRVPGIGEVTVERMKPYVALEPLAVETEDDSAEDMDAMPEMDAPLPVLSDSENESEVEEVVEHVEVEEVEAPMQALTMDVAPPILLPDVVVEATPADVAELEEEHALPQIELLPDDEILPDMHDLLSPIEEPIAEPGIMEQMPEPVEEGMKGPEQGPETEKEAPAGSEGPRYVTRGQFTWIGLLILILAMAFGVALSLGILSGVNGGLRYVAPERVAAISREVTALSTRAGAMQDTLDSVQTRLDNLEALSGRIDALEATTGGLQSDMAALTAEVDTLDAMLKDLNSQTEALRNEMDAVTAQATRFQGVMDGLRDILNNLFPTE